MYCITVKYQVKPQSTANFMEQVAEFTAATRAEVVYIFFDWSVSVMAPSEFVLVEAFRDDEAAAAHVNSAQFSAGIESMRPHLVSTAKIVSRKVDGEGWDSMGELVID